jgi:hypothetical protein
MGGQLLPIIDFSQWWLSRCSRTDIAADSLKATCIDLLCD